MRKFNRNLTDSKYLTEGNRKQDSNYFRRRIAGKKVSFISQFVKNTEQLIIVSSIVFPLCKTGLIDRLLILAKQEEVKPIIIFTKKDLIENYREKIKQKKLLEKIAFYQKNYETYFISNEKDYNEIEKKKNFSKIRDSLKNKTSAIVGHSGVGKTTLLNNLDPLYNGKTDGVSLYTKRGKHTTTRVNLSVFSFGGKFYDMPGLKEIHFFSMRKDELSLYYLDFLKYSKKCKYYNCSHSHEKDCMVKNAVAQEKILSFRYNNYLKIFEELY